jgi:S-formylglutathione hydrolase FrmB
MRMFRPLLVLLLSVAAVAQGRIDCDAMQSHTLKEIVHYCLLLPPEYDSPLSQSRAYPVLYFLHGLGENEQTLFKSGGWNLVEDLRQQHKISDFLIVTPEGKASFYVNSANGKARYSDFFLQEFVPSIESKYRIRRDRRFRAISGISMGGYGAFRFAFAYPQMFSAVSAESAALMTASPQQLNATMRSGAPLGHLLGPVFGDPINGVHWNENNPFVLAKKNRVLISKLAIYFNCGRDDEYQFDIGSEALHHELDSEGIKNEFRLYAGDHSASYFLSHLGELMQFHSQHFEADKR